MANIIINTRKKLLPPEAIIRFTGGKTVLNISAINYIVTLNAGASSDPDGTIAAFIWEKRINNGNWTIINSTTISNTTDNISATNTYHYRVKVIDNDGLESYSSAITLNFIKSGVETLVARINNNSTTYNVVVESGVFSVFDGSASTTDSGRIVSYSWEVVQSADDFSLISPNSISTQFRATFPGVYELVLEIINSNGDRDSNNVIITIL